jgi:hypothetical protein
MSGMSTASPTPRRLKSPSWLDARLLIGVLLVLGSVLVGAKIVSGAGQSYRMLAASRDMAAGTLLTAGDVSAVAVRLPDRGRGIYLSTDTVVAGKRLNRAVVRGELVPAAALGVPAATTTLTVPFDEGNAPELRAGQRIEVWISTRSCPSSVLLGDVTVQSADAAGGSAFGSGSGQDVVLSVAPSLAQRVVAALALGESGGAGAVIRAGVLSGPVQPGVNDQLPDLAGCAVTSGSS